MKKWIRWLPAVICMLVIFTFSNQPEKELDTFLPFFQKFFPAMNDFNWGHFVAYFVLSFTFYFALGRTDWKTKCLAVLLCVLYGLTDEFHQRFVAGRTPDIMDVRNDAIGATLCMLILSIPILHRVYKTIFFIPLNTSRQSEGKPPEKSNT